MRKCGVFIPSHSKQVIPIPIPMKLAYGFPLAWEFYGTHGNFQYRLIFTLSYCSNAHTLSHMAVLSHSVTQLYHERKAACHQRRNALGNHGVELQKYISGV